MENVKVKRRRWPWVVLGLLGLVAGGLFAVRAYLRGGSTPPVANSPPPQVDTPPEDAEDRRTREMLVGRWRRSDYYGETTLTLNPDGTGRMFVEFSGAYSFLVDDSLDAEIRWSCRDGRCVFDSLRGEPPAAFQMVTKLKGTRRDQKVVEVTAEQATFLDDVHHKGEKTWQRLPPQ